jgi:hypothetical protein
LSCVCEVLHPFHERMVVQVFILRVQEVKSHNFVDRFLSLEAFHQHSSVLLV